MALHLAVNARAGTARALIALGLGAAVSTAVGTSALAASGRTSGYTVSVTRCPTSYGAPGGRAPSIPRTIRVTVNATGLAAYSNGWMTTLAPARWHCSGGVGADGNEELTVLPPYVARESTAAAAVTVQRQWNGVAIYNACPFFPELGRGYGVQCPAIPKREQIYRLSAHTVAFEDSPGVRGTGTPSGGPMPANGIVTYGYEGNTAKTRQLTVGEATCTLPARQHALCTSVLNDFLSRWRR